MLFEISISPFFLFSCSLPSITYHLLSWCGFKKKTPKFKHWLSWCYLWQHTIGCLHAVYNLQSTIDCLHAVCYLQSTIVCLHAVYYPQLPLVVFMLFVIHNPPFVIFMLFVIYSPPLVVLMQFVIYSPPLIVLVPNCCHSHGWNLGLALSIQSNCPMAFANQKPMTAKVQLLAFTILHHFQQTWERVKTSFWHHINNQICSKYSYVLAKILEEEMGNANSWEILCQISHDTDCHCTLIATVSVKLGNGAKSPSLK